MNKEECMLAIAFYNSLFAMQCMEGKFDEANKIYEFLKVLRAIFREIQYG